MVWWRNCITKEDLRQKGKRELCLIFGFVMLLTLCYNYNLNLELGWFWKNGYENGTEAPLYFYLRFYKKDVQESLVCPGLF